MMVHLLPLVLVLAAAAATMTPPHPSTSTSTSSSTTTKTNQLWMAAYEFPAADCAKLKAAPGGPWLNLHPQLDVAADVVRCAAAGVRALWNVEKLFFNGSAGLGTKSCPSTPGGCIYPDWRRRWAGLLPTLRPLVANGSLVGFNLGDELICHTLAYSNISAVAAAIRADFPSAIIWWNECGHTVADAGEGEWEGHTMIPAAASWLSIDYPYARKRPLLPYPPPGTSPPWDMHNVTLAPVAEVRAYLEHYVYPRLTPHQQVMLLPPAFGSRCFQDVHPAPATTCPSLACADDRAAGLVKDYLAWTVEDPKIAAIAPTFFRGGCHSAKAAANAACLAATCKMPIVSVACAFCAFRIRLFSQTARHRIDSLCADTH
eukprot:SAG22_NODE_643_length_8222_cov_5.448972_5_plen_373_part_00